MLYPISYYTGSLATLIISLHLGLVLNDTDHPLEKLIIRERPASSGMNARRCRGGRCGSRVQVPSSERGLVSSLFSLWDEYPA